jgi:Tannase and feruloyl esterase
VAIALVQKQYGTSPRHSYFIGGSQGGHEAFALGRTPTPSQWPTNQDATQYQEAAGTVRYVITRDLNANPLTFDPSKWATRITEVSDIWDANSVDLSQFMSKGGKVILTVGSIDHTITPYNTVNYYERLVNRFGQTVADTFVRFYRIPGFAHGNGLFNAKFDALGALDAWVDGGRAPGTLEAVDINPENHQRRRPVCVYPAWPRYNGSGEVNTASSFTCASFLPDMCCQPHPGMNAALVFLVSLFLLSVGFIGGARGDEVVGIEREAFGCDSCQVQQRVQRIHPAATKFLDLGERMHLAPVVHRQEMLADQQVRVGRSHVPRTDRAETCELFDEVLKRDASVPNARARASTCRRWRVECLRIAGIHQVHDDIA